MLRLASIPYSPNIHSVGHICLVPRMFSRERSIIRGGVLYVILVQEALGNARGDIEPSPGCGGGDPPLHGLGHEAQGPSVNER